MSKLIPVYIRVVPAKSNHSRERETATSATQTNTRAHIARIRVTDCIDLMQANMPMQLISDAAAAREERISALVLYSPARLKHEIC